VLKRLMLERLVVLILDSLVLWMLWRCMLWLLMLGLQWSFNAGGIYITIYTGRLGPTMPLYRGDSNLRAIDGWVTPGIRHNIVTRPLLGMLRYRVYLVKKRLMLAVRRLGSAGETDAGISVMGLGPCVLLCRYISRLWVECWLVTRQRSPRIRYVYPMRPLLTTG
jgi:hypothetical protein